MILDDQETIAKNIDALNTKIRLAEKEFNRPPNSVILLAASKTQSISKIKAAIQAGQYRFGENYLQEAIPKIKALQEDPRLEWHFIGAIQSNKTSLIAEYFHWVHSVTSVKIAEKLNQHRAASQSPLQICIQVNISGENSKSGIAPNQLFDLARAIRPLSHLRLRGLMAIPATAHHFDEQYAVFLKMANLQKELQEFMHREKWAYSADTLSLGMSNDFTAAIAAGASLVRIGEAVFGARDSH